MNKIEDKHCYTPVKEEGQRGIYRVAKVTWNQGGYQPLGAWTQMIRMRWISL